MRRKQLNRVLGDNLRALRESLGLSQEALAWKCDIHRTYVGGIERGERNVTLDTLQRLAASLKTDPIELLRSHDVVVEISSRRTPRRGVRMTDTKLELALQILDTHYQQFEAAKTFADTTDQLVPSDTKSWSQILICALTGQKGLARKKGADLADGSDVKAANCWSAIDTPRFNGAIPSGRKSEKSKKPLDVSALDGIPFIYFVLWDSTPTTKQPRCRIWCVRPPKDRHFRRMAGDWYKLRVEGKIKSDNFQLHPPRFRDDDVIRNECGNLSYPLLLSVVRKANRFEVVHYSPDVLISGECSPAKS